MSKKNKIERVDLFGDIRKIAYDPERKLFNGVGRLSFREVSRLIAKVAEHYGTSKTKRGKRIAEISNELARLIVEDGDFMAETYAYIAGGVSIVLSPDEKVIKMENEY